MLTLKNSHGYQVTLLETGGAIQSILMPDREGKLGDIVLGFDDPADYPGLGSIGAFVGRYANRIAGGTFQLNGRTYLSHATKEKIPFTAAMAITCAGGSWSRQRKAQPLPSSTRMGRRAFRETFMSVWMFS